jgi:uncharacterized protein
MKAQNSPCIVAALKDLLTVAEIPQVSGKFTHRAAIDARTERQRPLTVRARTSSGDQVSGGQRVLYIIYQEDRDDGAEIRAANREAHFAYLEQHRDILVLGGALIADDGIGRIGSCLILNVPGRAQAEAFSRDEPFRKAGLFKSVKITRMRRGQWNPAAAPTTAEGN